MYKVEDLENSIFKAEDFEAVICLGEGRKYYILKDGMPHCCVIVDDNSMFETGTICEVFFVAPHNDEVIIMSLNDLMVKQKIRPDGYFCKTALVNNILLISDCTGITALNRNLEVLWSKHNLAIDGVILGEMVSEDVIEISCEMDPPGGWVSKMINISTGELS